MNKNIVISSRIRLARNFKKYKFPCKMSKEESINLIEELKNIFEKSRYKYKYIDLDNSTRLENILLIEKNIITNDVLKSNNKKGVFIFERQNASIMINEEDHIRIQCIKKNDNIKDAQEVVNKLDNIIESKLEYAYDKKYGYITSCPTNIGTGMRASYMVHLPILDITSQIKKVMMYLSTLGMTVRGVYGEGTDAKGNLFQISNQITLGKNEDEIIKKLNDLNEQIISQEIRLRNKVYSEQRIKLEDEVYRAYGVLTNAKIITIKEAMLLLSYIKLGVFLDIMDNKEINNKDIYDLMIKIQKGHIERYVGEKLSIERRDIKRAEIIKDYIGKANKKRDKK